MKTQPPVRRHRHAVILWVSMWGLGLLAGGAQAHNPHDPVYSMDLSPAFSSDHTMFVAVSPELNWGKADILRSTDAGQTWRKVPTGLDNRFEFTDVRVSPDFSRDGGVYGATAGDGVFRSNDRGERWARYNDGLPRLAVTHLVALAVPGEGVVLLAALRAGGLYRRGDADATWQAVLPESVLVTSLAANGAPGAVPLAAAPAGDGSVWVSTDAGRQWHRSDQRVPGDLLDVAISPTLQPTIYLASNPAGLLFSDDLGASFSSGRSPPGGEGVNRVAVSPTFASDRTIFCTTPNRAVFRSTNDGLEWTLFDAHISPRTTHVPAQLEFTDLHVSPTFDRDGTLFLASYPGLFRSTDRGATYQELQTRRDLITGVALSPTFSTDHRALISTYDGAGVYASGDGGTTWAPANAGLPYENGKLSANDIAFSRAFRGVALAVVTRNRDVVGRSADFGQTWDVVPLPLLPVRDGALPESVYASVLGLSPDVDRASVIYLGAREHGVLVSADGGGSWIRGAGVPSGSGSVVTGVAVSRGHATDRTAFVTTSRGEVFRTRDAGATWLRVAAGTTFDYRSKQRAMVVLSPAFTHDRMVLVGTDDGLILSIDGGDNWMRIATPNEDVGAARVIEHIAMSSTFVHDRTVFVGVRGRGLIRLHLTRRGYLAASANLGRPLLERGIQFTEFQLSPQYQVDGTLIGVSRRDIGRSTDRGATWQWFGPPGP